MSQMLSTRGFNLRPGAFKQSDLSGEMLPNKNQDFSIVHLLTLKNASFVVLTNSKELLFYQKVGLVR